MNTLKRENHQLQEKIKSLTQQNQDYQKQINTQIQEQTVKENNADAESKAIQFVKTYHNFSLNQQDRLQQLKKLMVPEAFAKKIETNPQQTEESRSNVQARINITNVQSFEEENSRKFNIGYEYIGSVNNTENFVERLNIVVQMVISEGKWLVNDFDLTYEEGPEGQIH